MATPQVYGVQETISKLKSVEPELFKRARSDLRVAVEPVANSIKAYIPNEAPLRGMRHNGRTSWQPSNIKVSVRTDFSRRAFSQERALVKVVVGGKKGTRGAAGLQIADMAGKRGKVRNSGRTGEYQKRGTTMRHRLNGQGRSMIDYLTGNWGTPSRFVWRAAELHRSTVQTSVLQTLDKISADVNKQMWTK
jgi:hypothetical protein